MKHQKHEEPEMTEAPAAEDEEADDDETGEEPEAPAAEDDEADRRCRPVAEEGQTGEDQKHQQLKMIKQMMVQSS